MGIDYVTAAQNLLIYDEVGVALQALDAAGVPVILLKGVALARTVYPSIADRPMGDVDLLVRPADRDRARAGLAAVGYRFVPEPRQRFSPFDTEFTGEMIFQRSDWVSVELHWELVSNDWMRRLVALDPEALWREAVPLQLDGQQALQLAPYDTLLHLCLHLTAHGYVHPWAENDLLSLLAHDSPFPWKQFVARACAFRMRSLCYFVLRALPTDGNVVPQQMLEALKPPAWQRRLVQLLADPGEVMAGRVGVSRSRSYLIHLAVADRPADILRVLVWLFFPGRRWLAERYRLQGRYRPLGACFWHPLLVAWHGAWAVGDLASSRLRRRHAVSSNASGTQPMDGGTPG